MRRELSKAEVERLFVEAVDDALPPADAARLESELAADEALKGDYERYQRAVKLLRNEPKEKAPEALASAILRRTRRRRFSLRTAQLHEAHRFPAEVIVPLLLAAVVAVMILMAAR